MTETETETERERACLKLGKGHFPGRRVSGTYKTFDEVGVCTRVKQARGILGHVVGSIEQGEDLLGGYGGGGLLCHQKGRDDAGNLELHLGVFLFRWSSEALLRWDGERYVLLVLRVCTAYERVRG